VSMSMRHRGERWIRLQLQKKKKKKHVN